MSGSGYRFRYMIFSLIAVGICGLSGCGGSGEPSAVSDDEVKQFLEANPDNKTPAPPSEAGSFSLE